MAVSIFDKWWFRAFAALMFFFLLQMYVTFSKVMTFDEDKMSLTAEYLKIASLERKRDAVLMDIMTKERDLVRLKKSNDHHEMLLRDRLRLLGPAGKSEPMIYFITPTHFRPAQKADLTRLAYTLAHVPNLHWLVVEDSDSLSTSVATILKSMFRSRLPYTHIHAKTPASNKMKYSDPNWYLPRGVEQRNTALAWLRRQSLAPYTSVTTTHTYDLRLFEDIRSVSRIGVWPVGIVGGLIVETPAVSRNGSIIGFNSIWKPERPFPIDMAAFAVNLTAILKHPDAGFKFDVPRGYQESQFLTSLGLNRLDLEPKASNCTQVYVWHTRTEKTPLGKADLNRITNWGDSNFTEVEAAALGLAGQVNDERY